MDKQKLFSIGYVARLFHLSVSSLRHYEAIGLISPEYIDPDSGYRYYGAKQFEIINTIRYLRALDMPLAEIADFLNNRDVELIEEKLRERRDAVIAKQAELKRIERKINNRLHMIADAKCSVFDTVYLTHKAACQMVRVGSSFKIHSYWDPEMPLRELDRDQAEPIVFLGKVGVSVSVQNLLNGNFDSYDSVFLIPDKEDHFDGDVTYLPETLCAAVRFCGSHSEAPEQYRKLLSYIKAHKLMITDFSREIVMIDYGLTNDKNRFVTEISIPVAPMDDVVVAN